MKFSMNFEMDNDSFFTGEATPRLTGGRLRLILSEIAESMLDVHFYSPEQADLENNGGVVRDINGNTIGRWDIEEGE